MNEDSYEDTHEAHKLSGFIAGLILFVGLLLGGLAGAGAMLLLAPQSGKKTRRQIRRQARDLRRHTATAVESGVKDVRSKAHEISTSMHDQAEDLQQLGQDVIDHHTDR